MSEMGKEFAEAADLLAPDETKEVELQTIKKKVKIRQLTFGEIADIAKVAQNDLEQYVWVVYKGLVEPKLKVDQVKKMAPLVLVELAYHIQKYSGLDQDSIKKLENLLKTNISLQPSK